MDRRLAGILAICLVLSTTITLLLIGEKSSGATIIENLFPDAIYRSRDRGSLTFHHGMVSRQRFATLTMDFYALRKTDLNLTLDFDEATLGSLSEDLAEISALSQASRELDIEPMFLTMEVEMDDRRMRLKLLDFTNVFDGFAPSEVKQFPQGMGGSLYASPSPTLCFAFLFDDSGRLDSTYEGVRDFFFDRDLTVADLYFRRNDETSSFISSRLGPQPEGRRVLDAPRGHLAFDNVGRDDRLDVGFSVNSLWLPGRIRMVQLILVYGDGCPLYTQANFIE